MSKSKASMNISRGQLVISLLLTTIIASACGGLNRSDKPATPTWWLDAYGVDVGAGMDVGAPSSKLVTKVALTVAVVPGLDTHRILTLSDHAEMNKYAGARWAESLPELMSSLLSRSLNASGRFDVASRGKGAEKCDLYVEVQKFYARLDVSGKTTAVEFAMTGRYLCDGAEPIHIRLSTSESVNDDRMRVMVAACQRALEELTQELIEII